MCCPLVDTFLNCNFQRNRQLLLSLVAQVGKNPPAMCETQVGSLGREDPLEKRTATHSSVLAWRIPWTEAWWLQSVGP